ncbi:MAG: sulfatase-like hydrolase/transferase [Gammaproteobacteria bacterium]|nr:sulfatase-like hydrolase/transferase [Gammaproteobacteria bacterium]
MQRRHLLKGVGAAALLPAALSHAIKGKKTNVILILTDDTGYEVFGCYGSKQYKTPRVDRLAETGMRFNHCYSNPVCAPSRVKIMTGKSNVRNYVHWGVLDPAERTLGHMMKDAGYATCVAGKWQLEGGGTFAPETQGAGTLPRDAGFDEHFCYELRSGQKDYWNPVFTVNGQSVQKENTYGPTLVNDYVLDFIDRKKEEPFFIYYPLWLTHGPFLPTPDSADRSPTASQQNFEDMVAYMDKLVGRVVDKLDEAGIREDTLILFTADNGSPGGAKGGIVSELHGRKIDGGKGKTTDAGTRVALVANMPGTVPAGQITDDLVDFSDMMPTLAGMTGAPLPGGDLLDGVSFAPQLRGRQGKPRDWIYMYNEPIPGPVPNPTIFARDQRWKLYNDGRLYDISKDVLEQSPTQGGSEARAKLQAVLDSMPSEGLKIYRPKTDPMAGRNTGSLQ